MQFQLNILIQQLLSTSADHLFANGFNIHSLSVYLWLKKLLIICFPVVLTTADHMFTCDSNIS